MPLFNLLILCLAKKKSINSVCAFSFCLKTDLSQMKGDGGKAEKTVLGMSVRALLLSTES